MKVGTIATTLTLLLSASLAAVGCSAADADDGEEQSSEVTTQNVAWAMPAWADRKAWYTTPQGSFLIEADIFLALEQGAAAFASPANLEPLGFVYPPANEAGIVTQDPRLPLGVVRDKRKNDPRTYVGFTCAACHTGVIETRSADTQEKKRYIVDGGQSFLNFTAFLTSLRSSLDAVAVAGPKQTKLCVKLDESDDLAKCQARIVAARDRVAGMVSRNVDGAGGPEGPGRLDALTREANEIFSHQLANEPTYKLDAPISFPQVWDAARLSCLQTNCLPLDPLSRNVSEQIAVFGETKAHHVGGNVVTQGTAELENLYTLEHTLVSLKSPQWTATSLPALDEAKVARGATLFKSTCASCHTEPYRSDAPADAFVDEGGNASSAKIWHATGALVGTDNAFLDAHFSRFVSDPLLIDVFNRKLWEGAAAKLGMDPNSIFGAFVIAPAVEVAKAGLALKGFYDFWGNPLELAVFGALTDAVIDDELLLQEPDATKRAKLRSRYEFDRKPTGSATDIQLYRARPLNGIAFTAPFGHNGSWPTLADVLSPPNTRPTSFVIRPGSFDPVRVGLDIKPAQAGASSGSDVFTFDGTRPGNTPIGHTYGTTLPAADKLALIEYLKSI